MKISIRSIKALAPWGGLESGEGSLVGRADVSLFDDDCRGGIDIEGVEIWALKGHTESEEEPFRFELQGPPGVRIPEIEGLEMIAETWKKINVLMESLGIDSVTVIFDINLQCSPTEATAFNGSESDIPF